MDPEPTPVGEAASEATEGPIGPDGGSVMSADGVPFVVVPPGALSEATTIRVELITNTAWGGVGDAYRLSPDGQDFEEPVELRFSYLDQAVGGSTPQALSVAYQDEEGLWRAYKEVDVDPDAGLIRVTTTHFSDWARVARWRLDPVFSTILPTETVELSVQTCLPDTDTAASDPFSYLTRSVTSMLRSGPAIRPVASSTTPSKSLTSTEPDASPYTW